MNEQTAATPVPLVVERSFEVPAERVFNAWLSADSMRHWLFATPNGKMLRVEAEPRLGGHFVVVEQRGEITAEHFGTYLELAPHHRLVFSFATNREEEPTNVTVDIRPQGSGCKLTLRLLVQPKWVPFLDRARAGWTMILDHLAAALPSKFDGNSQAS